MSNPQAIATGPGREGLLSRIILTGFMGAGKSTVGAILAGILGWRFVDLDRFIEAENGISVAEIFDRRGEPYFRELERQAAKKLMDDTNLVLALGGGAVEDSMTRSLIHSSPQTCSIYLEAPLPVLLARCTAEEGGRPLLAAAEPVELRHERRLPQYRAAQITVSTRDLNPREVARQIIEKIEQQWLIRTRI